MAEKSKGILGPTGEALMGNVKRVREAQKLTYVELSERLTGLDRPIPVLGLRRIERGERRVDVDDLIALATALGVTPVDLLVPDSEESEEAAAAARLRIAGVPAPWADVSKVLVRLAMFASIYPDAHQTIRSLLQRGWLGEEDEASVQLALRNSVAMRRYPNELPEGNE